MCDWKMVRILDFCREKLQVGRLFCFLRFFYRSRYLAHKFDESQWTWIFETLYVSVQKAITFKPCYKEEKEVREIRNSSTIIYITLSTQSKYHSFNYYSLLLLLIKILKNDVLLLPPLNQHQHRHHTLHQADHRQHDTPLSQLDISVYLEVRAQIQTYPRSSHPSLSLLR